MRRSILLGIILAAALGTSGAQRVTVQQLDRILDSSGPAPIAGEDLGRTDLLDQINREDSLAPRLSALELTERLTPEARTRLVAKYKLGPLTQSALELLSDRSALLDPPASELPTLPSPNADAQKTMLRQAGAFVFQTLTHLPDFFALLTTEHFNDGPVVIRGETLSEEPGMHLVGSSEREITFSEGREVFDSGRPVMPGRRHDEGLHSQGEFGSEAAIVFLDLQHGSVSFHHWERSVVGPVAVFRFAVPLASSHYEVKYACRGQQTFQSQPAYHGTLSIDPTTGVLVRFTLQAEASEGDPITQIASAIDYGPVVLGERRYFCPVRSLVFTVEEEDTCREAHKRRLVHPIAMLNRIVFTDYHRLGSEMVIVPGAQPPETPREGPEPVDPKTTTPPQIAPAVPQVPPSRW